MKPVFLLAIFIISLQSSARDKKIIFYNNGRTQFEYEMEGHMLDGKFACYYENGKLKMKGQFTADQKTGLWRVWDEKGLLRSERNYQNNQRFTFETLYDSTGVKIKNVSEPEMYLDRDKNSDIGLFSHRFLSLINKNDPENSALFNDDGLVNALIQNAKDGNYMAFAEDRMIYPGNPNHFNTYTIKDVVGLLVKEEYVCSSSDQTMNNRLIDICPVVEKNGIRKELGWFYVPDLTSKTDAVKKIKNHEYVSTIVKTTVNDPAFKMREVSAKENDLLRLMLVEFEANAIVYTIDNQLVAMGSNKQP